MQSVSRGRLFLQWNIPIGGSHLLHDLVGGAKGAKGVLYPSKVCSRSTSCTQYLLVARRLPVLCRR